MHRIIAIILLTLSTNVFAEYPNKPIRLIVASSPGSAPDLIARLLGDKLAQRLGQPVIVENKPGAGGVIAMRQLKQAPADGYTLSIVQAAAAVVTPLTYKQANYDIDKDFDIVGTIADGPMMIVAGPSFQGKGFADFLKQARENPGKLTIGSSTRGSIPNLTNELMAAKAGVDFQVVTFSGSGQGIQSTVGGDVMLFTDGIAPLLSLVKAGRLRALAIAAEKPVAGLEDIPLAKEFIPNFAMSGWAILVGPKGLPPQITARLNADMNQVISLNEFTQKLAELGLFPKVGSSQNAKDYVKAAKSELEKAIKQAGIAPE
ncbi:Tripartite-type tricarboxylate transporter, receptor component TctC [Variovorax sp. PDC80]|uniref:Bug family tripartite tricarboxylate transporter substrate binding protein n=1 Tax=Variovorax sp. PDC80 TaxID=1882827 RepID=UPI0008EF4FAC|nr:tripartite tricarboxylate transporter substrate binding protein [Variovorax sp. PDC80]SFN98976.1 Tripartite-type tricarboxylate transporter, receptor component TctC [Variovorax sp. PDC80]